MPSFKIPFLSKQFFQISSKILLELLKSNLIIWVMWLFLSSATLFILLWLPNLDLLFNIMRSSISIADKIDFLLTTPEILSSSYNFFPALLLVVISILQGLSLSLVIWFWVRLRKKNSKVLAANGAAVGLAAITAGCAGCGAGILYPLLSGFGATAASTLPLINTLLMLLGVLVLIYTVHRISLALGPEAKQLSK